MLPVEELHKWQIRTPKGWVDVQLGQLTEGDVVRCADEPTRRVFQVAKRPAMEVDLVTDTSDFCPKCGADVIKSPEGVVLKCSNWQHPDVPDVYAEGGNRSCDFAMKGGRP